MAADSRLCTKYDIVIVGGRPAGASLAARLGAEGVHVLVIDKATFPSRPAVPSCPVLYPAGMMLLDELGVDESAYGAGSIRVQTLVVEVGDWFATRFTPYESHGRDYIYSLDRAPFDNALWQHLARYPSVTARSDVAFADLVRDEGGRVTGIDAKLADGSSQRVLADVVVGADGRFSAVARKAGAKVTEDCSDWASTMYYATWEGFAEYDRGPERGAFIHVTGRGLDVLHFPMAEGRTTICTQHRADRAEVGGDVEAYYEGLLRSLPGERRRLADARRVTPVTGVKRVGNRYVDVGGPGWFLVGDAAHHKDPLDGQGIHDALAGSKLLAESLLHVRSGALTFDAALARYRERLLAETRPMFLATMARLKRELYFEPPTVVIRTLMRWLITDPEYKRRFLQFLNRDIAPDNWLPASLVRDAALRGAMSDLHGLVRRLRGQDITTSPV